MDINYSKKNIGNINTVSANNTRIKFNNANFKLESSFFQSESDLKEAKKMSIEKLAIINQLNNYFLDPATTNEDVIAVQKDFSEGEWEEYYKELSPEAKERVKAAEEWKRKKEEEDNKPWWQKGLEAIGGFAAGVVSYPARLLEKGVDFTVSVGSAVLSKCTYLFQIESGVDAQEFRDAIEGWSKDFIAEDWTKKGRDAVLDEWGASDYLKKWAEDGEDTANKVVRGALKTGAQSLKPPYKYIAAGALAADTYAEEIQTAYQRGATYDEGICTAASCGIVDGGVHLIPGKGYIAFFAKTYVADTGKDTLRFGIYDYKNTDSNLGEYLLEHAGANTLDAATSGSFMKSSGKIMKNFGGKLIKSQQGYYSISSIAQVSAKKMGTSSITTFGIKNAIRDKNINALSQSTVGIDLSQFDKK